MPQFLARPQDLEPARGRAVLAGEEARHLVVVLRARPGDRVELFDGLGHRWSGRFAGGDGDAARLDCLEPLPSNEPPLEVELVQAIPKGESWEWILEKGTELGVTGFQPVFTRRSVPQIPASRLEGKRRRWTKRIVSAAKQCERGLLPRLADPVDLATHLDRVGGNGEREVRLFLAERSDGTAPCRATRGLLRVRVAVGPEGGWSSAERHALVRAGFRPMSLGPRILRAETAAAAALVVVQARWGDLEGAAPGW